MTPLRTGSALAATVALFYSLCTLAWLLSPAAFLKFMNALFHGMSFDGLVGATGFDAGAFVMALTILATWAFLAGTFFGWISGRMVNARSRIESFPEART